MLKTLRVLFFLSLLLLFNRDSSALDLGAPSFSLPAPVAYAPDAYRAILNRCVINRYYSPGLGRFLSLDPAGDVDGMNLYAYVRGNSVNGVDPFGLKTWLLMVGDNYPSVPFMQAAIDLKNQIESSADFCQFNDTVAIEDVRKVSDINSALLRNTEIVEMHFFTHSGPGILYLNMADDQAESNLTKYGGMHKILFGFSGKYNSQGFSQLSKQNVIPGGNLFVHGCHSTTIANQLGEYFGLNGDGIYYASYFPKVDGVYDSVGFYKYIYLLSRAKVEGETLAEYLKGEWEQRTRTVLKYFGL